MSEARLIVGGRRYDGWKSVQITRTIEAMSGSFSLSVSDHWAGQDLPWPIAAEEPCQVRIGDETVIDGWIGGRSIAIAATERTLSYRGRDRCSILADGELRGQTFRQATAFDIARAIAEPLGVRVSMQAGIDLTKIDKLVAGPGEKADRVILEAAQSAGVLVVSDGEGGILLTRAGYGRASVPLVQGQNVIAMSMDYDADERFARYEVLSQTAGTDATSGEATRIAASVTDTEVKRTERVHYIRPEKGLTAESALQLATWDMRVRRARALGVTIVVRGWRQDDDGDLWPVNGLAPVHCPAIGVVGDLLISNAEHSLDDTGGEVTQLRLVPPSSFDPEPVLKEQELRAYKGKRSKGGGGGYPEIAKGV
jgi:prophage tail gpP-like protein